MLYYILKGTRGPRSVFRGKEKEIIMRSAAMMREVDKRCLTAYDRSMFISQRFIMPKYAMWYGGNLMLE